MIRSIAILLLAFQLSGCAAVVASTAISESDAKKRFLHQLEGTNLGRRSQGLPELDPCSERFWFDRDWALHDGKCAPQIHRWEVGDSTALNPAGMVREGFRPTVPESVQRAYDKRWQHQRDSLGMYW